MKDTLGDTPFDLFSPPPAAEQARQIARVRSRIGLRIIEFFNARGVGAEFHADDLRKHVAGDASTAPGSSDRIMRDLRAGGLIDYAVVNRRQSLYRITAIRVKHD